MLNKYIDEYGTVMYIIINSNNDISERTVLKDKILFAMEFPKINNNKILFKMLDFIKNKKFIRKKIIIEFLKNYGTKNIMKINNLDEIKEILYHFDFTINKYLKEEQKELLF